LIALHRGIYKVSSQVWLVVLLHVWLTEVREVECNPVGPL